jgi:Na+-transporting NADH:ubiquinone oxidoreductase subunit A
MGKVIKIKKGKDIGLIGEASLEIRGKLSAATYAVKPTDFNGIIPKMEVKVGDEVQAGSALFHHKAIPSLKFTSPVSGEVVEIVRGERRAIQEVKILADKSNSYVDFGSADPNNTSREDIIKKIQAAGLWPSLRQRPFNSIADAEDEPKAIFISGFDSAPLAANVDFIIKNDISSFQTGINTLNKLSAGAVHLSLRKGQEGSLGSVKNCEIHSFDGPHPAGVVGVQIHHIDPINKGEVAWTINPQHVVAIGKLFETGQLHLEKIVAVAGSEVNNPAYYEAISGVSIESAASDLKTSNNRFISGNVLTGTAISQTGYLGYFDNLITIIPEGDQYEFLGWLFPTYARPTNSNSMPISKFLKKKFKVNTNMHGEHRAFVMSGEYEKVLPMDIMPVQLLKSILAKDLEKMENLGIYEVVEEDLALCEFVCTSKIDVQDILREGIDLMEAES